MASISSKLLKHLGLSKKGPPHPPKPDYGTQKSTSVQELLPTKSPTRDAARSTLSLVNTAGSSHSDFDTASLGDSPHHSYYGRDPPGTEHRGARAKDSSKSTSPKGKCHTLPLSRHSYTTNSDTLDNEDKSPSNGSDEHAESGKGATTATPPQILDEYSDPFDLKQQMAEPTELLGACASAPVAEDDYSVPYDVKKPISELKDGEVGRSPRKVHHGSGEDGAVVVGYSPVRSHYPTETKDNRPGDEYDPPWDCRANQNPLLTDASGGINQNQTPLMTPKRTNILSGSPCGSGSPDLEEGRPENGVSTHSKEDVKVVSQGEGGPIGEEDDEGYTHLKEELGTDKPLAPVTSQPQQQQQQQQRPPDVRPKDHRAGNYEEPWDLTATQKNLEEKLLAVSVKEIAEKTAPAPTRTPGAPHEQDPRPDEGYIKPWDWKPDQKDGRPNEGYQKPWDWCQEKKDDRPPGEYEEPWDKKSKNIEIDLIHAKSAKEAAVLAAVSSGKEGAPPSANGILSGPSLGQKMEDTRPMDEYEEPWDQKMKKMAVSRTGSDSSGKSGQSPVLRGSQGRSPKKGKHDASWTPPMAERINPMIPLDGQGWYHGDIGRNEAESLLRIHKEGSYLVRLSESIKQDYSLSIKHAHGFMHMRITKGTGKYILGQFSQPFDSIPLMVHHYSISKLPIKGQDHMSLLHPIIHETL